MIRAPGIKLVCRQKGLRVLQSQLMPVTYLRLFHVCRNIVFPGQIESRGRTFVVADRISSKRRGRRVANNMSLVAQGNIPIPAVVNR